MTSLIAAYLTFGIVISGYLVFLSLRKRGLEKSNRTVTIVILTIPIGASNNLVGR